MTHDLRRLTFSTRHLQDFGLIKSSNDNSIKLKVTKRRCWMAREQTSISKFSDPWIALKKHRKVLRRIKWCKVRNNIKPNIIKIINLYIKANVYRKATNSYHNLNRDCFPSRNCVDLCDPNKWITVSEDNK